MPIYTWSPAEEQLLMNNYQTMTVDSLAEKLGRTPGQVRGKKERMGLNVTFLSTQWTTAETSLLRQYYQVAGKTGLINLIKLAEILGRDKANVCRKAVELGLETSMYRKGVKQPKQARFPGLDLSIYRTNNPHPKGMLGKHHSEEAKKRIGAASLISESWKNRPPMTQERRQQVSLQSIALNKSGNGYSRTKKGWEVIGEKRYFFKSAWEVNYANYLEFLKKAHHIADWLYEPETFWFEKIRRGVRSYTPDFKVTYPDGTIEYHEVKGWMDAKSKTKLARMKTYHKSIKMVLVDEEQYRALKRHILAGASAATAATPATMDAALIATVARKWEIFMAFSGGWLDGWVRKVVENQ